MSAVEPLTESDRALRTTACSKFTYADSVLYLRNQPGDYVVNPTNALAGTYGAKPYGLSIDPTTGAINVSKSETGLRYTVFYVKTGTTDTCTHDITISGIDFANSLHILSQDDTMVNPVFNGVNKSMVGTNGIGFDVLSSLTGLLSLRGMGLAIDPLTASIDLKKTMASGLFGLIPVSGTSVTVRLYYTINDASQGALNHIDLRFTYYKKLSEVPASLLNKIRPTSAQTKAGARTAASAADDGGGSKARPPEIVIVG